MNINVCVCVCVCVCQITELLTDVERLKQALNGLSQLAYTSSAPNKRQTLLIDTLHGQIKSLQQQLDVSGHTGNDIIMCTFCRFYIPFTAQ